jgi:hypothetical protein
MYHHLFQPVQHGLEARSATLKFRPMSRESSVFDDLVAPIRVIDWHTGKFNSSEFTRLPVFHVDLALVVIIAINLLIGVYHSLQLVTDESGIVLAIHLHGFDQSPIKASEKRGMDL